MISSRASHQPRRLLRLLTVTLLLAAGHVANAGLLKPDVDFSHYDTPVYEQITDRIKEKVFARLGPEKNTRDRYFIVPFAFQKSGNNPKTSHSFLSVIRVFADQNQPKLTDGLKAQRYKNREFEAFTISWVPNDYTTKPFFVFEGFGARVDPKLNKAETSPGVILTLEQTIHQAAKVHTSIAMWGPYEVAKAGFDAGVRRTRLLDTGKIKYRADDRLSRKDESAINCFHAISSLHLPFPNGGIFNTGFEMWGINGTGRVLLEYTTEPTLKGILLEPVNVNKDIYGFVYAPAQGSHQVYNPFQHASAYRK